MTPLDRLRYHVTGAIERGEATAIVGIAPAQFPHVQRTDEGYSCLTPNIPPTPSPFRAKALQYDEMFLRNGEDMRETGRWYRNDRRVEE